MKNTVALARIRKNFPNVEVIKDARAPVLLKVKAEDSKARRKDPTDCALARACRRQLKVDGAIINISTSYLIKGKTAIRFKTSETVAREITSFDRHGDFAAGKDYRLGPMSPSDLRSHHTGGSRKVTGKGTKLRTRVHHTTNIRVTRHAND